MAAGERFVNIKPTMGPGADSLRFALNVTPQMGVLQRRPAIRAIELGYGVIENPTLGGGDDGNYPTGAGGPTADAPNAFYDASGQVYAVSFQKVPDTEINPITGNATHPAALYGGSSSTQYNPANTIEEGIDVELIHGKLVCMYLTRAMANVSSLDEKVYLAWSWHMPGDPRLGCNKGSTLGTHASFLAATNNPVSSYYLGHETGDGHGLLGFSRPGQHAYTMASYWDKRIHKVLDAFMMTGKGVGTSHIGGGIVTAPAVQGNINADSIVLWNGLPLKMMGPPEVITTDSSGNISRTDPFSSIYVDHAPKSAFAHTDRLGQTIWYGFRPGDIYVLETALPDADVTVNIPPGDLSTDKTNVTMGSYDVWYSEPNNPMSLPSVGIIPVLNGSRAADVVSLAEFNHGTVVFTRDSIQYITGVGSDAESASRRVLSMGMGADSRWATKEVGGGVAFCNRAGLHFLDPKGQARRLIAFDELFNDGIVAERSPYNAQQGGTGVASDDDLIYTADNTGDVFPWKHYQVDKTRLDRAVGAVWGDIYLLFVSRTIDETGDDNRLVLVWNWKENAFSTWLLPKNMGVRGWAYDGTLTCPYVMTRYGLAMFDPDWTNDEIWVHSTAETARNTIATGVPVPVLGQTHRFPATGDGFVVPHTTVTHTVKLDDSVDDGPAEVGSALAMHIQMWTQTSELSIARHDRNTNDIVNAKNLVLQNLYKGSFKGFRKAAASGDFHNRRPEPVGSNTDISYRINGAIVRTSTCRSGGHALRHRMQFFTLNHSDILGIAVGVAPVSPKGRRA
jgi:hypothetical protein